MNKRILAAVMAVAILLFIPAAHSKNRFNIMRFYPNPDSGRFFHLLDSRTLYQWQFSTGTLGSFSYSPIEEKNTGRKIIDKLWEQHFFGTIGLADWIETSIDIPLAVWGSYIDPDAFITAKTQLKTNIGDPRFMVKAQVLDRDRYPIGLAIAPFVTIPVGKQQYFIAESGVHGGGDVVLDARLGNYIVVGLNAGVEGGKGVNFRDIERGSFQVRFGGGVSVAPASGFTITAEGFTRTSTNRFFKDKLHSPTEVIGGISCDIGKTGLRAYAGGGGGVIRGAGAPRFRAFGGLSYRLMLSKYIAMDRERREMIAERTAARRIHKPEEFKRQRMITDMKEKCPPPEQFNPEMHDAGCPKYYELKEVAELVIRCPANPANYNPAVHDAGCPKVYTLKLDMPEDEVKTIYAMSMVELALRCPDTPEQYREGVHDEACPKYYDLKLVSDLITKCPSRPEDYNPDIHDAFCPKVYVLQETYGKEGWVVVKTMSLSDVDKDTVPDLMDRCPAERGLTERMGCSSAKVEVDGEILKTAQPIEFAFNSVEIKRAMVPVLVEIAEALVANPSMRLRIEGYADIVGTKRANRSVSQLRADRVKDFLVYIGVDASRLDAVGMGATNFVAPNETATGRARNRRVVFIIVR